MAKKRAKRRSNWPTTTAARHQASIEAGHNRDQRRHRNQMLELLRRHWTKGEVRRLFGLPRQHNLVRPPTAVQLAAAAKSAGLGKVSARMMRSVFSKVTAAFPLFPGPRPTRRGWP